MSEGKKNTGLIIAGVVFLVIASGLGGYIYIKRKREKSPSRGEDAENFDIAIINGHESGSGPVTPVNANQSAYASLPLGSFPIKKGQKSKFVWILQTYANCKHKANLKIDGNMGTKTEEMLYKHYDTKQINSVAHLTQLLARDGDPNTGCVAILRRQLEKAEQASASMKNFANFV